MSHPLFKQLLGDEDAMAHVDHRIERCQALRRRRTVAGATGSRDVRVDDEKPGGDRGHGSVGGSRSKAACAYSLSTSAATSAKSTGQSPKAPVSSGVLLRIREAPDSGSRSNQWATT